MARISSEVFLDCELVAVDAVVIAKDYRVPCCGPAICAVEGCYWRKWHGLPKERFAIKVDVDLNTD